MEFLRRADKRVWGWSALAWLVISVLGAFWALPHIEDELDEESLGVESYTSAEGATVEWNGRDGYLSVPEGTANAEEIAADLADITGTRDVEIAFTDAPTPAAPVADLTPADFEVVWDDDGVEGDGVVPNGMGNDLNSLLGTGADLAPDPTRSLEDGTVMTLRSDVAPLIGGSLVAGTLTVSDETITVTGVAPDEATQAEVEAQLDAAGVANTIRVADATPAVFDVTWVDSGIEQSGDAPTELSDAVTDLGVASPATADGLTFGDNVSPALEALAPLVGNELVSGNVSVNDAEVVITGTAPNQDALDAAESALAGLDATVNLRLDGGAAAQASIDDLLALDKIEFVSGTATPTAETEAIIDEVAAVLTEFPDVTIDVIGHTDSQGDDAANQALSEARATAVVDGLVARGIDASRMTASGLGETEPIDTNDTAEGRQTNRRVEIDAKESN